MTQAGACADAGASLISPFVGRIMDWYKKKEGREFAAHEVSFQSSAPTMLGVSLQALLPLC